MVWKISIVYQASSAYNWDISHFLQAQQVQDPSVNTFGWSWPPDKDYQFIIIIIIIIIIIVIIIIIITIYKFPDCK